MRRSQIVALCVAVGALIAAAITPGVIGSSSTPGVPSDPADPAKMVHKGFTIDRVVTDNSGPVPSVFVTAHQGAREVKPGDPGYVPEPKPGEPGHEATGDGR